MRVKASGLGLRTGHEELSWQGADSGAGHRPSRKVKMKGRQHPASTPRMCWGTALGNPRIPCGWLDSLLLLKVSRGQHFEARMEGLRVALAGRH